MKHSYPTPSEFRRGVLAFRESEKRDAMYRVAAYLVNQFWGQPRDLADGVGVLLLTWNQAFYRYGPPDLQRFEQLLAREASTLEQLRNRDISSLSGADDQTVRALFDSALESLQSASGKSSGRRSPVAVAKALHLLAPSFFPLWDDKIASAYGCGYARDPARKYLKFMAISKDTITHLRAVIDDLLDEKTALKVLDEYNYAKFTKEWV